MFIMEEQNILLFILSLPLGLPNYPRGCLGNSPIYLGIVRDKSVHASSIKSNLDFWRRKRYVRTYHAQARLTVSPRMCLVCKEEKKGWDKYTPKNLGGPNSLDRAHLHLTSIPIIYIQSPTVSASEAKNGYAQYSSALHFSALDLPKFFAPPSSCHVRQDTYLRSYLLSTTTTETRESDGYCRLL